jgi:hypothetical protein
MTIEQAEHALDQAFRDLGRLGSVTAVGKRRGMEAKYGQAYQALVRLGARPQIRAKYRVSGT